MRTHLGSLLFLFAFDGVLRAGRAVCLLTQSCLRRLPAAVPQPRLRPRQSRGRW